MWSLEYADGSANMYRFTRQGPRTRVEYVPVMATESSTGLYTGGLPRTIFLDATETTTLHEHLGRLEASGRPSDGGPRAKGTGYLELVDGQTRRAFVVPAGPALQAFDAFLHASSRVTEE